MKGIHTKRPLMFPCPNNKPDLKWARQVEQVARLKVRAGEEIAGFEIAMLSDALTLMVNEHDGLQAQVEAAKPPAPTHCHFHGYKLDKYGKCPVQARGFP